MIFLFVFITDPVAEKPNQIHLWLNEWMNEETGGTKTSVMPVKEQAEENKNANESLFGIHSN